MDHRQSLNAALALAASGLALLAATAPAGAAGPSITVGSYFLAANTPHQPIAIRVSGVQGVAGVDLNAPSAGGTGTFYPLFSGVDLTTGTLFAGNNNGASDMGSGTFPRVATWSLLTAAGTVSSADGLLATLYIDTTGESSGTYSLSLSNTLGGPTVFYDSTGLTKIPITIADGSFTIVPEPASAAFFLLAAPVFLLRRKR